MSGVRVTEITTAQLAALWTWARVSTDRANDQPIKIERFPAGQRTIGVAQEGRTATIDANGRITP